ncbi:MAG: hypothetical protein JXO51_05730 [Candidatus Aminicenantes bacterium]|nr:hypothetical protein [Candidatus Aminicenantes bacterium]
MKIDSYAFGRMVVDGREYTKDLILYPDHVDPTWWREEGHRLSLRDLEGALAANPDVLVVGTGFFGAMQVPDEVRRAVAAHGIDLRAARSAEAVDLLRSLSGDRKVVAAFHLTC